MPQRAHVTSLEAIESFRAKLITYVSRARSALEEVTAEVLQTRIWLENDRRTYWENQVLRRTRAFEDARAALFSARLAHLRTESSAEQLLFHRAKQALEEAQAKLHRLKVWDRQFDTRTQPLVKQMEKLHAVLSHDMTQAIASLGQAVTSLAAYAEIKSPTEAGLPLPIDASAPSRGEAETPPGAAPAQTGTEHLT